MNQTLNLRSVPHSIAAGALLLAGLFLHAGARAAGPQAPSPQAHAPARPDDEVLAIVDGIALTRLQWDRLAEPYFQEVAARAGRNLTDDEKSLLRKNVLEELIRERLWVADAKRRGFTVTDAELDARLSRNEFFKTNGKFDPVKFRQFKFSPETNYRQISDQVRNAVLLDKYVAWMKTRYAVPETELRKEFQSRTAQASIRYLWLIPDVISLEPQATPDQIRAYYESHAQEFSTPEEARLTYIRVQVEASSGVSDSLRVIAEKRALSSAKALIAALRAGRPVATLAKEFGGVKDTGIFRVGEAIRGLGLSQGLTDLIRSAKPKQWLPEPVRVGPYFLVARVEEHRKPGVRSFRDAAPVVKSRADLLAREALIDSLARLDYAKRPEKYRVPELTAAVLARATDSFVDSRPVSERDVAKTLERIRKGAGLPDTARAWADSIMKNLPDLVRKERQLDLAFKTMGEAAGRLRRGDRPEDVAKRYGAMLDPVTIYRGQPPEQPSLLEGAFLDSLYQVSAGTVAGPRVMRDSVFVVRVAEVNDRFQPPYPAVRSMAHAEVEAARRLEAERASERFYEEHKDRYRTPQRWIFDYVRFQKMKPDKTPVPADSIRVYYEEHPQEFTVPGRAHARHILVAFRPGDGPGARSAARKKASVTLARIKAGGDFAAIAKELSDDRASAAQGGDLGEITRGQVVKEFGDAVFALKPGELSPVVETQFGFHIIRVESMTPQRLRTLEETREEIRGVLGETLADSLARSEAEAFTESAAKPGAKFEDLAKAHGGASSSGPVAQHEPVPGLGALPDIQANIGTLPEGGVSGPIPIEGGFLVARLTRSLPPRPATFGEVKAQALEDMRTEQRRAVADSVRAALEQRIRAGGDLETLALPLGGLKLSRSFPRRGPVPDLARDSVLARDSSFYREIFAARPGAVLKPRRGAMGTLFAVVDSVTTLSPKQYAEHREDLREELFEQRTAAWTERLRSRAKIQLLWKELRL